MFLLGSLGVAAAESRQPVFNQSPLASVPYANLPLGSIKARGWLLNQLENQRDGLTGNSEIMIPEIGPDSGWRGGQGEGWEKGPHYLKGLVPLAYTLDDPTLKQRAQGWIDAILASQQADGFYGPGARDKVDWALRDYYEATDDARVLKHLANYYRYMAANLPKRPLFDWARPAPPTKWKPCSGSTTKPATSPFWGWRTFWGNKLGTGWTFAATTAFSTTGCRTKTAGDWQGEWKIMAQHRHCDR